MSVFKPSRYKTYRYDFTVNGRRFCGSTKEKTKSAALKVESRLKKEALNRLEEVSLTDMTLDIAAGLYWDRHAQHLADAEQIEYRIGLILNIVGKSTLLREIDNKKIDNFISVRRAQRNLNHKKGVAPIISHATVNKEVGVLRAILNRAAQHQDATIKNIDWKNHKLREAEHPDRPLTREQENLIWHELVPHARPIISFMLLVGQRKTNCMDLTWDQIDFERKVIEFRVKSKTPGGRIEVVPIGEGLMTLFEYIGIKKTGPVWVFGGSCDCWHCQTRAGQPIKTIRRTFNTAVKRAGINRKVRFHDLRHTVGHRILEATGDLRLVQQFLGHQDIRSTLRYAKHGIDKKREVMDLLYESPANNPAKIPK